MVAGALKTWWRELVTPFAPASRRERLALGLCLIVVSASRLAALSLTLWDRDEALFALALGEYDVTLHQPHPPGFPLFIAAARLLPLDPFASLRAVALLASLLVFPAAYLLARELRAGTATALASALLLSFSPNVWFFGGTAFSDIPALALALGAAALLLRGCRSGGALLAGALLLGIGAGMRPQNLLLGAVPMLLAFSHRRRAAVAGAALVAIVAGTAFVVAAQFSGGWGPWLETVREHERYIRAHDSFLSPIRPSLLRVADDFLVRPYRAPLINAVMALLVAGSLVTMRRRPQRLLALAIFGPFVLFAWLYLDFHSASRFSIAYMPLVAFLAADVLPEKMRVPAGALLAAMMAFWTWPMLSVVRSTPSPPVAAIESIRAGDRNSTIVYIDDRLGAHADLLLDGFERRDAGPGVPAFGAERCRAVVLREGTSAVAGAQNFARDAARFSALVRPRYLATAVVPARRFRFGDGWYAEEGSACAPFRWMSQRSSIALPPQAGRGTLTLRFALQPAAGAVELRVDGRLLGRIDPVAGPIERTWAVKDARELTIETEGSIQAPGDPRALSLRLDLIELR